MNSNPSTSGPTNERETPWMEKTYPMDSRLIGPALGAVSNDHDSPAHRLAIHSRVSGPFGGYYIAVYAAPIGESLFMGNYKVCEQEPTSYWDADGLFSRC